MSRIELPNEKDKKMHFTYMGYDENGPFHSCGDFDDFADAARCIGAMHPNAKFVSIVNEPHAG